MEKSKTSVRIAGHEYTIVSHDAPEHIQRVAAYVDRRMMDLATASRLSPNIVSVLTAMNLADDLLKAQDENVRLRQQLLERTQGIG
ncbi:MAG: cell division protein ZapA [Oscillospiraceae bacterium]|nr:cell division protein ZapA [Oscillospiraceae bacterium]